MVRINLYRNFFPPGNRDKNSTSRDFSGNFETFFIAITYIIWLKPCLEKISDETFAAYEFEYCHFLLYC